MKTLISFVITGAFAISVGCGTTVTPNITNIDCTPKLDSISTLFAQKKYAEVVLACENISMCDTFATIRLMVYKGNSLYELQRYMDAIYVYTQVIASHPNLSAGFGKRALCFDKMGMNEEALRDYTEALAIDSTLLMERINRAEIYREEKLFISAKEDLDILLRRGEKHPAIYNNYGLMLSDQGYYSEAVKYFDLVFARDTIEGAAFNAAIAYYHLGDYSKSLSLMNTAVSMQPQFADYYYNRALIKIKLGDKRGSCSDFHKAGSLGINVSADLEQYCE